MRKKIRVFSAGIFLLLLLLALPSQAIYNEPVGFFDNYQLAWQVFSAADLAIKDIKLQAWGQINNKKSELAEIEEIYKRTAQALSVENKEPALQKDNSGNINLSWLEGNEKGEMCQLSLRTIPIPGTKGDGATYLAVLIVTQDRDYAQKTYRTLVEILQEIGLKEPLGLTFSGEIPNLISPEAKADRIASLASSVNGSYIEGAAQESYSSMCYFSSLGKDALDIQGQKINLNIALCDDIKAGKTYLHVGVPLIYQDY